MNGLFVWVSVRPMRCISGSGRNAPAHQKKEYMYMDEHKYKLYVVKKKKKVLKKTTKSFSNLQAFLYSLRKQGYVCEVEYPRRGK